MWILVLRALRDLFLIFRGVGLSSVFSKDGLMLVMAVRVGSEHSAGHLLLLGLYSLACTKAPRYYNGNCDSAVLYGGWPVLPA